MNRRRLPDRRGSERFEIEQAGQRYLVTTSRFADGKLAEVFIDSDKPNSAIAVHVGNSAILTSMLLQHGISAAEIQHSVDGPIAVALAKAEGQS